jgi:hypothetical protein
MPAATPPDPSIVANNRTASSRNTRFDLSSFYIRVG